MRFACVSPRSPLARSAQVAPLNVNVKWRRTDGGPAKDALPCLTPLSDQECNPFRSCPFLMNRAIVQSTSSDLGRTRTTSGSARARIKSMRHCLAVDGHDVMAPYKLRGGGGEWIDAETFAETLRRGRESDRLPCMRVRPPTHPYSQLWSVSRAIQLDGSTSVMFVRKVRKICTRARRD